jgi:deoxyribodipyrimidine photo-lyase
VLPLYVVEPALWRQPDRDRRHWDLLTACLRDLDRSLRTLGGALVVLAGDMTAVLTDLRQRHGRFELWAHEETGTRWTFDRDVAVRRWCRHEGVRFREFPQMGVVRGRRDRAGWARRWHGFMRQPTVPAPGAGEWLCDEAGIPLDRLDPPAVAGVPIDAPPAGREAALSTLRGFLRRRGEAYRRQISRPGPSWDSCSRLSTHLAMGSLSLREVVHASSARRDALRGQPPHARGDWAGSLAAFDERLHWHCHFIQKLESEPALEFDNLSPATADLRPAEPNREWFDAWREGRTGYPLIDACMRSLAATGWLNFRMRAMLVSFAAYDLWLHWREPGLHLARLFADYEPGIHYAQLQMQSGTTGINSLRIYNPIKQSREQDPDGDFIRRWVPELAGVSAQWIHEPWRMPGTLQRRCGVQLGRHYPTPIVDHDKAARRARRLLTNVRRSGDSRRAARETFLRHGSRRRPRARGATPRF